MGKVLTGKLLTPSFVGNNPEVKIRALQMELLTFDKIGGGVNIFSTEGLPSWRKAYRSVLKRYSRGIRILSQLGAKRIEQKIASQRSPLNTINFPFYNTLLLIIKMSSRLQSHKGIYLPTRVSQPKIATTFYYVL